MDVLRVSLMCVVVFVVVLIGALHAVWPINDEDTSIKHKVVTILITFAISIGVIFLFMFDF